MDRQGLSAAVKNRIDRKLGVVECCKTGFLPALRIDALVKISLLVKEPYRCERKPQIAGRFAMIARQHAEAA
jgi:hypothetical protein